MSAPRRENDPKRKFNPPPITGLNTNIRRDIVNHLIEGRPLDTERAANQVIYNNNNIDPRTIDDDLTHWDDSEESRKD